MLNNYFHLSAVGIGGVAVLAVLTPLHAQNTSVDLPSGTLYYAGLTEDAWQIFSLKIPDGDPVQLTNTGGDKRSPFWLADVQKLVARESTGDIILIKPEGGVEKFGHFELPVANYSFFKDGKNLLMTHLTSKSYRKQWIYRGDRGASATTLFAKPVTGSYRSVRISPDNLSFCCTLIQTFGEELLVVGEIDRPANARTLTPAGSSSAYPTWSSDGKMLYFSMKRVESGSWDLCSAETDGGEIHCLASTPGVDESTPFAEPSGKGLFFQSSGKNGMNIGYMDLTSFRSAIVGKTGSAQEPFFRAENGETGGNEH